jgi:AraC-like DNA-binding protein
MMSQDTLSLINPQTGKLAFKLFSFEDSDLFNHIQRLNYYTIIWTQIGHGKLKVNFSEYEFIDNSLFAFSPYQLFMLQAREKLKGIALNFHPDFFCIHKHQQEVACNGVLFNNIYLPPFVLVDPITESTLKMLLEQIKTEIQNPALAQYELLISYLKIFLITASRLKTEQQHETQQTIPNNKEPFILQNLKNYIELHFKNKHSASEYANLLNITPKALTKITKRHFNKTLTDLIAERIVIEAKSELYLTNKPVKTIAYELGYDDEYYFSRFFKNNANVSPQTYRDTVGFAKGE